MKLLRSKKLLVILGILAALAIVFFLLRPGKQVNFNAQVKPILNKKCISCHGGVRKKGDYSLLFREEALAVAKSGKRPIIPGNASGSELINRITSSDPEERMPYQHEPLSKEEIQILKKWINQGAEWGTHWAYMPVQQTPVPGSYSNNLNGNDIDRFILQKQEEAGLTHSPEAAKHILLRRTGLDVLGLPAPQHIAEQFLNDSSERAYATLLDSLLASKHYGEKWASMWLDLARYADTKGYEHDGDRVIWRYRDWLINAFNNDKPYNEFLTEQLAGDLMPGNDENRLIATAFHRNSMTNDEGGTEPEEFRTAAVIDRVNTTWEGLMGTTFACVQCHTHPYDPFTHEEYYRFLAFFNNSRDENTEFDYPLLRHFSDSANEKLNELTNWLGKITTEARVQEIKTFLKTWQPTINSVVFDEFTHSELGGGRRVVMRNNALFRLKNVQLTGKDQLIYRYDAFVNNGTWQIHLDKPDGPLLASIKLNSGKPHLDFGSTGFVSPGGVHDLYFTYTTTSPLKEVDEDCAIIEWLCFTQKFPGEGQPGYEAMKKRYWDLLKLEMPTTPVMMENPPELFRTTHLFERGNWLVKGNEVQPGVPQSLNPFPNNAPKNRLGLAMWLTSKQNPLTARTLVNRVWEQLFGTGLAETLEDLGTQGIPPIHTELLNWLSYRFMNEHGWSIKKLVKEIMMSAAYRQQSNTNDTLTEKDPYNKYLTRGPRVRLSAEQVRDQTLAVSGLLSRKMFGAPVMPWQPKGIWLSPWNYSEWKTSKGEDQYRRAIYTFWKRTAAYPSMLTFDGVAREVCVARRIKTNTPLQALVTLNDSVYLEAANYFAIRLLKENPGMAIPEIIKKAFSAALMREADAPSLTALNKLFQTALAEYTKNEQAKNKLLQNNDIKKPEAAALTVVMNALFNLDEFVMKV